VALKAAANMYNVSHRQLMLITCNINYDNCKQFLHIINTQ